MVDPGVIETVESRALNKGEDCINDTAMTHPGWGRGVATPPPTVSPAAGHSLSARERETATQTPLLQAQPSPAENSGTLHIWGLGILISSSYFSCLRSWGDPEMSHDCPRDVELCRGRERRGGGGEGEGLGV